jgi:hypothetical protein
MRTTTTCFVMAVLAVSLGIAQTPAGQDQTRTFYFTQPITNSDMTAMTTLVRTVVDIQNLSVDQGHKAVVATGSLEKLNATEWLFQQLDASAGNQATATPEYRMGDNSGEVVHILRFPPTATIADLTAMTTAIRTVADLQRLFPYEKQKAVVGRGTPEKVAAAEWLFHQLNPAPGETVSADSPAYPMPEIRDETAVVRIFRMAPGTTNQTLTALITAIRTVADIQRLFPYEAAKAIIMRGSTDKVAVAEFLVHALRTPIENSSPNATHEAQLPGVTDSVVRVFYLYHHNSSAELTTLVSQLRAATQIQRIFPFSQPAAVILRGQPDQMPLMEAMISKFGADIQ